nr:MAG TPA: hypothetical protein [Caudoviricetes sp.]
MYFSFWRLYLCQQTKLLNNFFTLILLSMPIERKR